MIGDRSTRILRTAQQAEHQAVGIDDAGMRRKNRGPADEIRLPGAHLFAREVLEIEPRDVASGVAQIGEDLLLRLVPRDHIFAG